MNPNRGIGSIPQDWEPQASPTLALLQPHFLCLWKTQPQLWIDDPLMTNWWKFHNQSPLRPWGCTQMETEFNKLFSPLEGPVPRSPSSGCKNSFNANPQCLGVWGIPMPIGNSHWSWFYSALTSFSGSKLWYSCRRGRQGWEAPHSLLCDPQAALGPSLFPSRSVWASPCP